MRCGEHYVGERKCCASGRAEGCTCALSCAHSTSHTTTLCTIRYTASARESRAHARANRERAGRLLPPTPPTPTTSRRSGTRDAWHEWMEPCLPRRQPPPPHRHPPSPTHPVAFAARVKAVASSTVSSGRARSRRGCGCIGTRGARSHDSRVPPPSPSPSEPPRWRRPGFPALCPSAAARGTPGAPAREGGSRALRRACAMPRRQLRPSRTSSSSWSTTGAVRLTPRGCVLRD